MVGYEQNNKNNCKADASQCWFRVGIWGIVGFLCCLGAVIGFWEENELL